MLVRQIQNAPDPNLWSDLCPAINGSPVRVLDQQVKVQFSDRCCAFPVGVVVLIDSSREISSRSRIMALARIWYTAASASIMQPRCDRRPPLYHSRVRLRYTVYSQYSGTSVNKNELILLLLLVKIIYN